jgi:hypothetical protein
MTVKETARYSVPRRRVAILQLLTTVCSVLALLLVVLNVTGELGTKANKSQVVTKTQFSQLQSERRAAATDTCHILQTVFVAATPPGKNKQLAAFLVKTGLDNCKTYGEQVINPRR